MTDLQFRATLQKRRMDEASVKEGGALKIRPANNEYALLVYNALSKYTEGEEVSVEIKDGDSYTERMNNLFHALVRKIVASGATNYWDKMGRAPETFEEVKSWIKIELGGAKIETVGQLTWIESWTKFSKKRASQTIDNTIDWCMKSGIDIDSEKLEFDNLRR